MHISASKVDLFHRFESNTTANRLFTSLLHRQSYHRYVTKVMYYTISAIDDFAECHIDVGAGNGILSIFSAQAGARTVYAIEASNMVENLQHLVNASSPDKKLERHDIKNPWLAGRIRPIHCKT